MMPQVEYLKAIAEVGFPVVACIGLYMTLRALISKLLSVVENNTRVMANVEAAMIRCVARQETPRHK
jgi:hypothetical protein